MNFASSFFQGTSIRQSLAGRRQVRFLWILPVLILAGILSGCCTILPGNDPLVVRAEQATRMLYSTTDKFLEWEYRNRARVGYLKPVADKMRRTVPGVLAVSRDALRAYKATKNAGTKADLVAALQPVDELLIDSKALAASIKGLQTASTP
jgi:hypothetical protein